MRDQGDSLRSTTAPPMELGYILSYGVPKHGRTELLVAALKQLPGLKVYEARNSSPGMRRYFETLWKLLRLRLRVHPEVYLLGFRGHEIYPLVRAIVDRKARLIFDEFVSPYDSFTQESKQFSSESLAGRVIYRIEQFILRNADVLLTDTQSNARHYARIFDVPESKFFPIPIGVDETLFSPDGPQHDYEVPGGFIVFTYATMKPLHGMDVVLDAAALVRDIPVQFFIAGGSGKMLADLQERMRTLSLTNIHHIKWIDFADLPAYIRGADLCLGGPFGNTPQSQRVITGKTVQFLACGKATVVGRSEEDPGFIHQQNCLLIPQKSAQELADAIRWAYENQARLNAIGQEAHRLFMSKFNLAAIAESMSQVLNWLKEH